MINSISNNSSSHSLLEGSVSRWETIAFIIVAVIGGTLLTLALLHLFGPSDSIEYMATLLAGVGCMALSISGIGFGCLFPNPISKEGQDSSFDLQVNEELKNGDFRVIQPIHHESQSKPSTMKICFVSDPSYVKHQTGYLHPENGYTHPEQPERVGAINAALEQAGLKDATNTVNPRSATKEEILLCHTDEYIQKVEQEIKALGETEVRQLSTGDAKISQGSAEAAYKAVGGVLTAVDQVFTGTTSKAFCVVRPPGHHASCARGAGFCLFNNVAIAARYAQTTYHIERVLIVDWDVHHGDGTQDIFYEDPSVFYFSTHEEGNYPGTGLAKETGEGLGTGFNMNVPIPGCRKTKIRTGTGQKVIQAFQTQLKEAMQQFQPELVLISCGFDGHNEDTLGGFDLQDEDYATLTRCVNEIADEHAQGRVISVLEGGYTLDAIARASVSHVRALIE